MPSGCKFFLASLVMFLAAAVQGQQSQRTAVDWDRSASPGFGGEAGNNENYSVNLSLDFEFRGKTGGERSSI